MRPLRLRIENFTCFRDAVELNFEGLNLFAITGPTGAGKSSLLDAMIFALYGKVPRMGGQGLAELISLGRDRMAVVFDFMVGHDNYRVARTIRRRSGAAHVQLDHIGSGGDMPVSSGVRETEDKIKQLVGLAYEAFTQAVVLPQGEFAHFLKSAPGDQRKILRDVLRLRVYERMRDLAARQRDHLKTVVGQLEDRLTKDYAGATAEALESRRQQEHQLADQINKLATELKAVEERLKTLRRRRDQTRELEQKRSLLAQLIKKEPAIKESEARIDAGRRAAPIMPLIEAAVNALQRANKAEADAKAARKERDDQRSVIEKLKSMLERMAREAEKLPELRKQISALEQILGQIRTRDSLQKRLVQSQAKIRELKSDLDAANKQEKSGRDELKQRQVLLVKANEDLESVGYDPELDRALDAVRNDATALGSLRETVTGQAEEFDAASERAKREQENAAHAGAAQEKAKERLHAATERVKQAQAARDAAHQQHAAAVLRRQLCPGEPCPVCDQPVSKRPAIIPAPHLEALEEKLDKARKDDVAAQKTAEEKHDTTTKAEATAKEAQRALEKAVRDLEKAQTKLESTDRQLDTKIGMLVAHESGPTIEKRILNCVARVTDLRQRHQRATAMRDKAQKACDETSGAIEKAKGAGDRAGALISQTESELKGLQEEIERVNYDIARVTDASDPKAERERLIGICTDLEDGVSKAQREHSTAEQRLAAAESKADETDKAARSAMQDVDEAQRKSRDAAGREGFADEAAVKKAALPSAEIRRLEAEMHGWRQDRDATARREKELADEIGDKQVSEEALHKEEGALSTRKKEHTNVLTEHAQCAQQIRHLEQQVKRATELVEELKGRRVDFSLYAQLSDDLRGERFQAFLLDEVFRDLVRGASERLWNLTDVYRLEWRDGTFYVVDHDNARQRRNADTLSGGETFLASLSLALELSEQVQRASGAVPLDSLFIDEGFGTLDRETLDDAAEAIERLPTGRRIVGIITHLEELSARLPARVRVEKQNGSSQIISDAVAN